METETEIEFNDIKKRKEIYDLAIKLFGMRSQMLIATEECSELIQAISHLIRGRINSFDLSEEIADVEIMCEQLRLMFDIDEFVDQQKQKKIKRLKNRIELFKCR